MELDGLRRFCWQVLQLWPDLSFPPNETLIEQQDALHRHLFADGAWPFPPPNHFQLLVLRELVGRIEGSIEDWDKYDVSDDLMTTLATLVVERLPSELEAVQQRSYVTYYLSALEGVQPAQVHARNTLLDGPFITLLESSAIISSSGTTGLRTWEAALYLGDYLCSHPGMVSGKRVLELGAGTGYISILCAKHLGALQVIASDGSADVVNSLPDNFFLNGLQDDAVISRRDLKWGHAIVGTEEREWNAGRKIDLVLGADIVYDQSAIVPLVGTLDELFDLFPAMTLLISVAIRNQSTYDKFKMVCQRRGYQHESVDFPLKPREEQNGPFYRTNLPIEICRLSRQ